MKRIFFLILLVASTSLFTSALTSYQLGILPSLNVNKKLPGDWSLNFKLESRQGLMKGLSGMTGDLDYEYLLTDFSLTAGKKTGINSTLAAGYLMRIENGTIHNRAIQQFSFVRIYPGLSLSHRISADQTFSPKEDTEFRFRYRLSSEMPLEGQTLDPGELYLKASNEYLNSFQDGEYDLEIRLVALLGYALSRQNKLEIGLDYRLDSFLDQNTRNRFWIGINFFHSI